MQFVNRKNLQLQEEGHWQNRFLREKRGISPGTRVGKEIRSRGDLGRYQKYVEGKGGIERKGNTEKRGGER